MTQHFSFLIIPPRLIFTHSLILVFILRLHPWKFGFDLIWFDLIWFDLIWFDLIWFDLRSHWSLLFLSSGQCSGFIFSIQLLGQCSCSLFYSVFSFQLSVFQCSVLSFQCGIRSSLLILTVQFRFKIQFNAQCWVFVAVIAVISVQICVHIVHFVFSLVFCSVQCWVFGSVFAVHFLGFTFYSHCSILS